jgi:hypothetical protein
MSRINRHTVLVHAAAHEIFPQLVLWGESEWWPKRSLMRYTRTGGGEVAVGARYHQKVLMPFGPEWDVEVLSLTGQEIVREFLNGMFRGKDIVRLAAGQGGVFVEFIMEYRVIGAIHSALWRLFFERMHDKNIELILTSLKRFVEERGPRSMEWNPGTREKLKQMLGLMPIFARTMAERMVSDKAEHNAQGRGSAAIEEGDMVRAFLSECPGPFRAQMLDGLEKVGLDRKKYE